MDWQHLIMNGESLAECAALLDAEGLLGHMHANSGWGTFDDDNMVGATAFMETLELAVELRRCGYGERGERLGFDLYPYTEDAVAAVRRSIVQWRFIESVAARIDDDALRGAQLAQGRGGRIRGRLRSARGLKRPCQGGAAPFEYRLTVRDEDPLIGSSSRGCIAARIFGWRTLAGNHDSGQQPYAALVGAEDAVARYEGVMAEIQRTCSVLRPDAYAWMPPRQDVTGPEDVGDGLRAPLHGRTAAARRPERGRRSAWRERPRCARARRS